MLRLRHGGSDSRARWRSWRARRAARAAASRSASATAGATVYATGRSTRERGARRSTAPRRSRRPPSSSTAAGGHGIAVAVDHLDPRRRSRARRADRRRAGPARRARQRRLGRRAPLRVGHAGVGARPRARAAAAAPGGRDPPHHQPPRAAAADRAARRPACRGDRRHGRVQRRALPRLAFYDLAKTVGDPAGVGAGPGARAARRHRRRADARAGCARRRCSRPSASPRTTWRDAIARVPHFCISETPALRRPRGRARSPPIPTSRAGAGSRCRAARSRRSTASPTSTAPGPTRGATSSRSRRPGAGGRHGLPLSARGTMFLSTLRPTIGRKRSGGGWWWSLWPARTAMVEADVEVPCVDGRTRPYVNLDYAASTPAMAGVLAVVEDFMTWYGSERTSRRLATAAYEGAHGAVAEFVGARDGTVVLVRNTAEAINVLAAALPRARASSTAPSTTRLPWGAARRHRPADSRPAAGSWWSAASTRCGSPDRGSTSSRSPARRRHRRGWPLAELAAVAHHYGAELFVDATQLALPSRHRHGGRRASTTSRCRATCSTRRSGSARRLRPACESASRCCRRRGDRLVTLDGSSRRRALRGGSPNVGAALARRLGEVGMDRVAAHERGLLARLAAGLAGVPGLQSTALCERPAPSTASAWRPSTSRATATRCWPRSSAPSTPSASPRTHAHALWPTCSRAGVSSSAAGQRTAQRELLGPRRWLDAWSRPGRSRAAGRAGATSTTARTTSTARHPTCARCRGRRATSPRPPARRRGR